MSCLRTALIVLVLASSSACTAPRKGHTSAPPEPAFSQAAAPQAGPVYIQLAEIRTQWDPQGTWGDFYSADNEQGFPGLHVPLDIVTIAQLVAATGFDLDPQNPNTDLQQQIRTRFKTVAATASKAKYVLGQGRPTQSGGVWHPKVTCTDNCLAFPVLTENEDPHCMAYEQAKDRCTGWSSYWVMFRLLQTMQP